MIYSFKNVQKGIQEFLLKIHISTKYKINLLTKAFIKIKLQSLESDSSKYPHICEC